MLINPEIELKMRKIPNKTSLVYKLGLAEVIETKSRSCFLEPGGGNVPRVLSLN